MSYLTKKTNTINFLKKVTPDVFDYSGGRYLLYLVKPPGKATTDLDSYRPPSTFFLWALGIYTAMFGLVSPKYENRIDTIENSTNMIISQLPVDKIRDLALNRIATVQNMKVSLEPNFLSPYTTISSFFSDNSEYHQPTVRLMMSVAEKYPEELSKKNFKEAQFQFANFVLANFQGANFYEADLSGAKLRFADFSCANMKNVVLTGADLSESGFISANLEGADLSGAKNISLEKISKAFTLYNASLPDSVKMHIHNNHPDLIKKPNRLNERCISNTADIS